VPSVFAHTKSPEKRRALGSLGKYEVREAMKKKKHQESSKPEAARGLLNLSAEMNVLHEVEDEIVEEAIVEEASISETNGKCDAMCQTNLTSDYIESLEFECQQLRGDTFALKEKLKPSDLEQSTFENSDKLKTFTGLPNYKVFMAVIDLITPLLKNTANITIFHQLLLTLMRIRLNLPIAFLSYLFGVHMSTISRVFTNVINILNDNLVPVCVVWPDRDDVQTSLPMCFRKSFKQCMSVIDCFEITIDRPKDLKARAQTYSQYKSHNTIKYLIGITPQGIISFISKGWGGRSTDAHITANSGFLDNLLPGDLILADRGFRIQEQVGLYCARVETPAFTRGKKQLGAVELEDSRKLAAVRIHVERVIGQARSKYRMLHGPVPISLLIKSSEEEEFTSLDKIVRVACALTNLCPSVVPID